MNEQTQLRAAHIAAQKAEAMYTAAAIRAHLAAEPTPVYYVDIDAAEIEQCFVRPVNRERLIRQLAELGTEVVD